MFIPIVFAPLFLFYNDNPLSSLGVPFVSTITTFLGTSALLKIQACWILMP
jgi:hypothetical protein